MILKLRQTPGLYLVGFMGCGKSTIGKLLADRLGWGFADIDKDIEASQQRSISDIFDSLGEEVFRRMESEALQAREACPHASAIHEPRTPGVVVRCDDQPHRRTRRAVTYSD